MSTTITPEKSRGRAASLVDTVRSIIHQKDGVMTRELLRTPGRFGLGQVPQRLKPDSTTDMVCGY
ncbi:MAG: hypothetical protein AAGG46_12315, partial [Planctomycetota bacterium]